MADEKKYVNVALNKFGQTTTYLCDIEGVKTGDFVIVSTLSGESTGRVMSCTNKKVFSISLAKIRKVKRLADPREINEVADVFGIAKNPAFADEEDEGSFFTNSGYGSKELNRALKKMYDKEMTSEETKPQYTLIKKEEDIPGYWRYVAIGILVLYFCRDYIMD